MSKQNAVTHAGQAAAPADQATRTVVAPPPSMVAQATDPLRGKIADTIGWMSLFAAVFSLVEFLFRYVPSPLVDGIGYGLDLINVVHEPSLSVAGMMLVFAVAAFLRKRVVVWVTIVFQAIVLTAVATNQVFNLFGPDRVWALSWIANVLSAIVIIAAVWWARPALPSRLSLKAAGLGIVVMLIGQALVFVIGFVSVELVPNRLFTDTHRLDWALRAMGFETVFGEDGLPSGGPAWLAFVLALLSGLAFFAGLLVFLRANRRQPRSAADDLAVHALLAKYPGDSLSYFATGTNRNVVFAPSGQAAVSFAEARGVSMAGGDPIGDPGQWDAAIQAWLAQTYQRGLIPGVISASEKGARAYRAAGLKIRLMGDEAVIAVDRFSLSDPQMKPLQVARRRVARAGVTITCRKLATITAEEQRTLQAAAAAYRVGDERGFSMALDRVLDPLDSQQLVVTAYDTDGVVQGLLTFVPFGRHGLSLNVMRRRPGSVNGVVEAMVLSLIDYCRDVHIAEISLNFAMLRNVFVQGAAVDAHLGDRLLRRIMQVFSRFWQLESLLESNARYQPSWRPRYFAYPDSARLTVVLTAAATLEGFLPSLLSRHAGTPSWLGDPTHAAAVQAIYASAAAAPALPQRKYSDQAQVRRQHAATLQAQGMDPYPPATPGVTVTALSELAHLPAGTTVTVHARVGKQRRHGGIVFLDVFTGSTKVQIACERDRCAHFSLLKLLDAGDLISVTGVLGATRTGCWSVFADSWQMLAKTLTPVALPPLWGANKPPSAPVSSPAAGVKNRTQALIAVPRQRELLYARSAAIAAVRHTLTDAGFLEVETPILQAVQGGANARPFTTHFNAYDAQAFLRIAPELYLKRLAIGGMDAIFEIGRSFRNEGVDATHNPEFTSLEAYRAGGDYTTMRHLTEALIRAAATAVHGEQVVWQPAAKVEQFSTDPLPFAPTPQVVEHSAALPSGMVAVDIAAPWPVVRVCDAVSAVVGEQIDITTEQAQLAAICDRLNVAIPPTATTASMITELYDELVESRTGLPTFYTDFPAEGSPLTRKHRDNPLLAERWDLVAFGMELGCAYTELTDPIDQRDRFVEQSLAAAAGDPEAMSVDEDFLHALELGLAPTGGMGMGIDRMVMLLLGVDIRSIIAFPYQRPTGGSYA
ncbi:bifunctional lysylphosphatidylglycerol synthetase/lysine--tRNA ligase LysX [Corynebacterium choanae]|uniref:Lysylphosphatidylglycerol biosynthesis bifunctional protein LysX n=1 Tax=Corynebacterium choanae TaxID=1862358 RepID=A0A3G6J3L7_9CORY|nr:bifunctional lysylphosphatidylglycerol synthetase/lysine--tRNA ligase LysX [Corynebacterium choanae]AZA12671.1 Lysylphosphatidylglycerol biosynthesis bifunctional protein LysX [Corynebacterium choanae]